MKYQQSAGKSPAGVLIVNGLQFEIENVRRSAWNRRRFPLFLLFDNHHFKLYYTDDGFLSAFWAIERKI